MDMAIIEMDRGLSTFIGFVMAVIQIEGELSE